jgi:hypothetical protein
LEQPKAKVVDFCDFNFFDGFAYFSRKCGGFLELTPKEYFTTSNYYLWEFLKHRFLPHNFNSLRDIFLLADCGI